MTIAQIMFHEDLKELKQEKSTRPNKGDAKSNLHCAKERKITLGVAGYVKIVSP